MEKVVQENLNKSAVSSRFLIPVVVDKVHFEKPIKTVNEDFTYIDYPGVNFGKSRPLMQSNKITVTSCNAQSDISIGNCNCRPSRSAGFYDLFLAKNTQVSGREESVKCNGEKQV